MKIQFWTDVSFAGSSTHNDLSTKAVTIFPNNTFKSIQQY